MNSMKLQSAGQAAIGSAHTAGPVGRLLAMPCLTPEKRHHGNPAMEIQLWKSGRLKQTAIGHTSSD